MKIHIGSGSVYLKGWTNIDLPGPHTFLASKRPDLVEKWGTTDEDYYAKHKDKTQSTLRPGPLDQEYVCDAFGSFDNIPAPYWETNEVLARHSFEHLSISEAHRALDQIDGIMAPNGILRLDVPDHEETLRLFRKTGDEFYIRHLLGPRRNDHGFDMMSYTRDRLRNLVEEHGFLFDSEEPNIHFYPAFCLRFKKPGPRVPVEYAVPPLDDRWTVVDVGPGPYPLMRANLFVDKISRHLNPLEELGKATAIGDLMTGMPEIRTKTFDYAWCSHVLEHVASPARAAETLSRIAKRGTLVVPSAWKESLGNFEESEHLWQVLPHPDSNKGPIFIRCCDERLNELRDINAMKVLSRVFRTGPNRVNDEQRFLRRWWYEKEPSLDIVHHWEGELKVTVIG